MEATKSKGSSLWGRIVKPLRGLLPGLGLAAGFFLPVACQQGQEWLSDAGTGQIPGSGSPAARRPTYAGIAPQATGGRFTRHVNPFIGTGSSNSPNPVPGGSGGSTMPGALAPFGMVQWSPDTPRGEPSGYKYSDTMIQSFSLTHFNGAGCANNEDIPILPISGSVVGSPGMRWDDYTSIFAHASEAASPGYYAVVLDRGKVGVELSATPRTGFGRFTFPGASRGTVLVDVSRNATGVQNGSVQISGDNQVTGSSIGGNFCGNHQTFKIFFAIQFDRPFADFGTWSAWTLSPLSRSVEGALSGAYLAFDTSDQPTVQMKVGLSYVSVENALLNLSSESPGWSFEAVRAATEQKWEAMLSRVEVEGGTPEQLQSFYTALYHVFSNPNIGSDVNGQYMGFDDAVHTAAGYTVYQNYSGWDIYRSWIQLVSLVAPQETLDMMKTMVQDGRECGALPKWTHQNKETDVMVGDPGAAIVSSAHAFGVRDFDTRAALALMDRTGSQPGASCQGKVIRPGLEPYLKYHFIPEDKAGGVWGSAATTLEYTSADFTVARFALALGDEATHQRYMSRAQYWSNLFNPSSGYIHPRYADQGWLANLEPHSDRAFVEGNAAQYTWMIPYNLQSLIDRLGGPEEAVQRLDNLFGELNAGIQRPYFYIGNEPQFTTPWAYHFALAPAKSSETVRRVMAECFNTSPGGLPGNDDLGAMSSWYVWAALGLYPAIPGTDVLAAHGSIFPALTIHLAHGNDLTITSALGGVEARYVQDFRVNGEKTTRSWLRFEDVAQGGSLAFTMGSTPDADFGTRPADAPPSYAQGMASTLAPKALGKNLAIGKSATVDSSCQPGESGQKAIDGTLAHNSKWCSSGKSRWLTIDLGAAQPVGAFVLEHAGWAGEITAWNTRDFSLEVSQDGSAWTKVVEVKGNLASRTIHPIKATTARYVRLSVLTPTSSGDGAARIYELEIYAPDARS